MSKFFIDRPIFATALAILIVLGGIVSALRLPIDRFPKITPPTVQVAAVYPGASAEVVAQNVSAPIEQELSGIPNLLYFQSYSANDGSMSLTATFEIGSDIDQAAIEVQNRLKNAEPRLPQEVARQGITIEKASSDLLMVISLKSTDPAHDELFLNGYANQMIIDRIRRVPGVGNATVFGAADYSMRIWLDPDRLTAKGLTVNDVAAAIREQNGLYAAGRIGAPPSPNGTEITVPVITRGRLEEADDFARIVVRARPDGSHTLLRDVARIELGSQSYNLFGRMDGEPTTFILTYLQPGGNALETSAGIKQAMEELKQDFPPGLAYVLPYDTTPFVRIGIVEVAKTFFEAMILVGLVVILFLGTWRATVIPLVAVPVAIIGTFTGMLALGFGINSLTLFGMVLAIGIVVDDAIIVVENVERIMHDEHLPVRPATIRAMEQVQGPIMAIVLVLSAVFLPVAFLGGLTGEMYQQFAVTIAISVAISGLVALTLSPALCVLLLTHEPKKLLPFRIFDSIFERFTRGYASAIRQTIRFAILTVLLFLGMIAVTWDLFHRVPGGFIPQEDQGYFIIAVMLPPGSSLERTSEVIADVETWLMAQPEVAHAVALGGMDFLAGFTANTSSGLMFASLKPWDERAGPGQTADALIGRMFGQFGGDKRAVVFPLNPPPVQGLGLRSGFEFQLQDRAGRTSIDLADATDRLLAAAAKRPELQRVNGSFNVVTPQLRLDLDILKTKVRGAAVNDVYETMQAFLGALYVNDFIKHGRIYRVQIQAESAYRRSVEMIGKFVVRNTEGRLVPLSDLIKTNFQAGPSFISRFNAYPSVQISGEPGPGYSTGETIKAMEELVRTELGEGWGFEWSGSSYQEIKAGREAPFIVAFGLVVVFLVLAALYERWSLPFVVLLGIPSGAFGAIIAIMLRGIPNDIYFQIGLLTLIGLAAKNAILIVEFSATLRQQGMAIKEAAVEAARVRLRPFIMTSLAFILGVLPLVIASGAGAAGRHSIGTGVMGGMIAATFLDMFFVPLLFVVFQTFSERMLGSRVEVTAPQADPAVAGSGGEAHHG